MLARKKSLIRMSKDEKMSCRFMVCGVEHSGTTLVSDLFRQVAGVDSGFEVGVLLRECPVEFLELQPFADNMLEGWKISQLQLEEACAEKTFDEFYVKLMELSPAISTETQYVFDKTPRYLSQLSACLKKTDKPFIACYKDPRATVFSDYKRSKAAEFAPWYNNYLPGKLRYLKICYREYETNKDNHRVEFIALEDLALNARNSMERIFRHVDLQFDLNYVVMNDLRYKNTHSNSVSIPIAFAYRNEFDQETQNAIERDFSELSDWFYR